MAVTIQELRGVVTANIADFRRKMKQVRSDTEEFRSNFGKTAASVSKATGSVATSLQRIGVAAAGATAVVVRQFAKFEETMTRVGAVTQTLGTKDFKALEDAAKRAGATTRFTATQSAEAMEALGLAGFNTTQIIGALPGALQLASSAQVDISTAADIAAKTMRAFGLAAKDTGRINDTLVATFTRANTDLRQLAEALKPVGPVAKSVGVSLEDTAAILAKMSDAGFQGSLAGTSLRNALIRLAAPSREAEKLLNDFGVTASDSLFVKLQKIESGMSGLANEQEKLAAAAEIFGVRGGPAMLAVFETGIGAVEEFSRGLQRAGGLAQRLEQANLQTLQARLDLLKSKFEAVFIEAGDEGAPKLKAAIDELTKFVSENADKLREFAVAMFQMASAVIKFVAEHPRLTAMLAALSAARLLGVTTALRDVGSALLSVGSSTRSLIVAGRTGGGLVGYLGAMKTASIAAKAGLVGLAIGGIVFLAKKIYENMPAIKAWDREQERRAELNKKLDEVRSRRQQRILDQAESIKKPGERRAFLASELETAQKKLKGLENSMSGAQQQYEEYRTGWREFTGNKVLQTFKDQLDETTGALDKQKEFVKQLEQELANTSQAPGPDGAQGGGAGVAISQEVGETVGDATVKGLKEKQEQISQILRDAQVSAIEKSAPEYGRISEFIAAGATPEQLNQLIEDMITEGGFTTADLTDDFVTAPTQLSDLQAQAGGASPEQLDDLSFKIAQAFEAMRAQAQATKDAAVANAEAIGSAWSSAQPSIESITGSFQSLPVEQANTFENRMRELQLALQNGDISADRFSFQIRQLADETEHAALAAKKEAQQKRMAALARGDFAGAGLNFGQAVRQRLQDQQAQFQQGRFDAAVQQMVNGMLGLQGATQGLQSSFGQFGQQLTDFGSNLTDFAGDLKGNGQQVQQAFGQLSAFLNSRQGAIAALQNEIALLQQNLRLPNLETRQRQALLDQIEFLMARIVELMNAPPPVLGDFAPDPIFDDPGLQDDSSGSGSSSKSGIHLHVSSVFPPTPETARQLVDVVGEEMFRRGWRV